MSCPDKLLTNEIISNFQQRKDSLIGLISSIVVRMSLMTGIDGRNIFRLKNGELREALRGDSIVNGKDRSRGRILTFRPSPN